ncbi:unnamed protein product [Rotaria sp. Silwood1]|nr:unnamed protein product [Rotaria sp. Silwood1]
MDVILWLFNLCLVNIQFNSVLLSFAIIGYNYVKLFIDLNKLSKSIHDYLQYENVFVYSYDSFYNEFKKMIESIDYNEKFCVSSTCNYAIQILISQKQFVIKDDIICRSKTIKDSFKIENDSDHDELVPWSRPDLLESPNITKRQSNISSDIIIHSQTTTSTIDSIDVKAFGLNQKLFNIWFKNNIQQLKINEDNHDNIEDILFLYIDSNEDDNHIGKIIVPDYKEKITNIIFNKKLNPHGYGYKQIIYDIIKDNMFIKLPYHPFETKLNKWVQQDYHTYGGQCRSLKVLLINEDADNASKNKHVHSLWSEDNEKNKEFYTFYHGCSEHAAHSICLNGLGLHWNHPKGTDFGPGVYVTKNVLDALVTAERRTLFRISNEPENRPACVVFQCPKDEFNRFLILKLNNNNINLNHDRPPITTMDITEDQIFEWPNFVHLCHHRRYPLPLVEDYDSIEGYICNNICQVQDNTHAPKCNLHTWQLCVRSVGFAKKFTSWITGIILLQIPDSSSTSSTTTVSHQK